MNKQQTRIIVIMLAVALALAAFVLLRDHAQPEGDGHDEHTEHAEEKEEAHADDGVIRFTPNQITVAGITVATAGPKHLDTFIRMPGQIALNEDRTAHVTPRAAGWCATSAPTWASRYARTRYWPASPAPTSPASAAR